MRRLPLNQSPPRRRFLAPEFQAKLNTVAKTNSQHAKRTILEELLLEAQNSRCNLSAIAVKRQAAKYGIFMP